MEYKAKTTWASVKKDFLRRQNDAVARTEETLKRLQEMKETVKRIGYVIRVNRKTGKIIRETIDYNTNKVIWTEKGIDSNEVLN